MSSRCAKKSEAYVKISSVQIFRAIILPPGFPLRTKLEYVLLKATALQY